MGGAAPERYATLVLFWGLFAGDGGALLVVAIWRFGRREELAAAAKGCAANGQRGADHRDPFFCAAHYPRYPHPVAAYARSAS
ncbi:MAG: hypothetical protein JOZ09_10190 [Pseudonocardiales bacterium]|jgi:hypothetical protein|nr:hypothetical protein [Pseudonocardiales bacterium]